MSLPAGELAHICEGRLRLAFHELRGDAEALAPLKAGLAEIDGVRSVTARAATGSVIVGFDGEAAPFLERLAAAKLFALSLPAPPPAIANLFLAEAADLDRAIRGVSGGALDLAGLAFLAFGSVGLLQLARGQLSFPAITAFWYAAETLRRARRPENAEEAGDKR